MRRLLDTQASAARRFARGLAVVAIGATVAACDTDQLLSVDAPQVIEPDAVVGATGAAALRAGIIGRVNGIAAGGEGMWMFGGLAADEWLNGDTFQQRSQTDLREVTEDNSFLSGIYRALNRVRVEAGPAIAALREANQPAQQVGELFALRAYAVILAAEHFCNGLTFGTIEGTDPVNGSPISTDSAFALAVAFADSALANTGGNATVRNLAATMKGRALINRGRWAEAAAAVSGVPLSFEYLTFHSANAGSNQLWSLNESSRRYSVADREGTNGLPFRSANDPRLPTGRFGANTAFDNTTQFFIQRKYGRFDPAPIANGIEAAMIRAEAALNQNNTTAWLAALNDARANGGVAGLAPLTDPGSQSARVDLTMQERAFWMFGTGHRFGDLRRLVRQYGRAQNTVFPTGAWHKGGNYGSMVAFPLPIEERNNPNVGTSGNICTNQNA